MVENVAASRAWGNQQRRYCAVSADAAKNQSVKRLLVIRDGLPPHRGKLVADYLRSTQRAMVVEYLPGYARAEPVGIYPGIQDAACVGQPVS
jgi:hypothetical protein